MQRLFLRQTDKQSPEAQTLESDHAAPLASRVNRRYARREPRVILRRKQGGFAARMKPAQALRQEGTDQRG